MRTIIDKLVLLLGGFTLLLQLQSISVFSVIALLVGVTISALTGVLTKRNVCYVSGIIYVLLCFTRTEFFCFLPLVFYDAFLSCRLPFGMAALLPIVTADGAFSSAVSRTIMILVFLVIAYVLCCRTSSLDCLHEEMVQIRDSSKENALLLQRKNKDLMEKQDYEVKLAILTERNRIAREIHDNVGHMLSRSILQVGALMAINKQDSVTAGLDGVQNTLSQAMDSIRSSVHDLHDESIDLNIQVQSLIGEFTFCPVKLNYDVEGIMNKNLKYAFLSIIREALSNITRHSNATQATITLREHPALYQLIIKDNGKGMHAHKSKGIGLQNMMDRVSAFNGNINIDDKDGFRIFISIPKGEQTV